MIPIVGRFGSVLYKHGAYSKGKATPEYWVWMNMRARCNRPSCPEYKNYGMRGIKVCEAWNASFLAFYLDMGDKPLGMSIERKNVDDGYCKDNCYWATSKEQTRNRRETVRIFYEGNLIALADVCERLQLNYPMIAGRVRSGWNLEYALTAPKGSKKA